MGDDLEARVSRIEDELDIKDGETRRRVVFNDLFGKKIILPQSADRMVTLYEGLSTVFFYEDDSVDGSAEPWGAPDLVEYDSGWNFETIDVVDE